MRAYLLLGLSGHTAPRDPRSHTSCLLMSGPPSARPGLPLLEIVYIDGACMSWLVQIVA
jgi:hypothetical protein